MNIVWYMLLMLGVLIVIAIVTKLLSEDAADPKPPGKSDSDRLDEIASRLEKIERAILNSGRPSHP